MGCHSTVFGPHDPPAGTIVVVRLMHRRHFLRSAAAGTLLPAAPPQSNAPVIDPATARDWLARWEPYILHSTRDRFCDKELGEGIGWRISPFLNGFYYGYLATGDAKWVTLFVDWTDSWIRRGIPEPDGFTGWPMPDPDGPGPVSAGHFASSLLGEAMAMRPVVLMAAEILRTPALRPQWESKARQYLDLGARTFEKWDSRGAWREVKQGGVWIEPSFGIDRATGKWTAEYASRASGGFTHPDNKQNAIAMWLLAMFDVTGKSIYRDRPNSGSASCAPDYRPARAAATSCG